MTRRAAASREHAARAERSTLLEMGSMRIRAVKMQEQGIEFFVALVKEDVVNAAEEANRAIANFQSVLQLPVVLCGDLSGKYFGRSDLAHYMGRTVHPSRIRWGTYEVDLLR